jgi:hypothetical protein
LGRCRRRRSATVEASLTSGLMGRFGIQAVWHGGGPQPRLPPTASATHLGLMAESPTFSGSSGRHQTDQSRHDECTPLHTHQDTVWSPGRLWRSMSRVRTSSCARVVLPRRGNGRTPISFGRRPRTLRTLHPPAAASEATRGARDQTGRFAPHGARAGWRFVRSVKRARTALGSPTRGPAKLEVARGGGRNRGCMSAHSCACVTSTPPYLKGGA